MFYAVSRSACTGKAGSSAEYNPSIFVCNTIWQEMYRREVYYAVSGRISDKRRGDSWGGSDWNGMHNNTTMEGSSVLSREYVAICSMDEPYANKLSEYINQKNQLSFGALVCTKEEILHQYLEEGRLCAIVMEEGIWESETPFELQGKIPLIILDKTRQSSDENRICKYAPVTTVMKRLQIVCGEEACEQKGTMTSVAVYSPIGRSGCTSLALGICQALQGEQTVLYLGMETYREEVVEEESVTMDEVLYHVKQRNERLPQIIRESCRKEQIWKVASPMVYLDMREWNYQDMKWFLQQLSGSRCFDMVVVDIGAGALGELKMLDCFDSVLITTRQGCEQNGKLMHFRKLMELENFRRLKRCIRYVSLPCMATGGPEWNGFIRQELTTKGVIAKARREE